MVYRQARPPRRVDWYRVAGCAIMMASSALILGVAYGLTIWVLSSGQP